MEIVRSGKEILRLKEDSTIVIWGAGAYGVELRCELNAESFYDYYICDSNHKVKEYIDNFISLEDLIQMAKKSPVSIILALKDDTAVREVADKINCANFHKGKKVLYRYIPETREELVVRRKKEGFYNGILYKRTLDDNSAVQVLMAKIIGTEPFLFARWGTIEGDVVYKQRAGIELSKNDYMTLQNNAGVFPNTDKVIKSYCKIMEGAAAQIDILCAFYWQKHFDKWLEWYSPNATIVSSALEYPFFNNPWTKALAGLKVLVIHPFAKLISEQYKNRKKLFKNKEVLPKFELIVYRAVQSMGGYSDYTDWVQALNAMQCDVSKIDFDIALIGCGAYGMPLGAFIKSELKKKAIHMGGSLQILFGIKGKRWEGNGYDYHSKLYNEYWVRPTDDLKPHNYRDVEGGCYW